VFDVLVENEMVVSNLDVYGAAGGNTAYTLEVEATCSDGSMTVELVGKVENPMLSAVEVIYKDELRQCGIPKVSTNFLFLLFSAVLLNFHSLNFAFLTIAHSSLETHGPIHETTHQSPIQFMLLKDREV